MDAAGIDPLTIGEIVKIVMVSLGVVVGFAGLAYYVLKPMG